MYKIIILAVLLAMLTACGSQKVERSSSTTAGAGQTETQKEKVYTVGESAYPVSGVSIIVKDCKIIDAVGDRDKDNYMKDNGEYMAVGRDIKPVLDYKQINVSVSITNDTEKAVTFSSLGWSAILTDGYKLQNITLDGKIGSQVASKGREDGTLKIIAEKKLNLGTVNLTYKYINFDDKWRNDLSQYTGGKMSETDYLKTVYTYTDYI